MNDLPLAWPTKGVLHSVSYKSWDLDRLVPHDPNWATKLDLTIFAGSLGGPSSNHDGNSTRDDEA